MMPAPFSIDENATSNCIAMYPPEDSPETEVCAISRLKLGSGGAARPLDANKAMPATAGSEIHQGHRQANLSMAFSVKNMPSARFAGAMRPRSLSPGAIKLGPGRSEGCDQPHT